MATEIEWTDETWNPIAAYDKATGKRGWICVHAGIDCLYCYAEKLNNFRGNGHKYRVPSLEKVEFRLVNVKQPLSWQEPRMIFVCSMTDLFLDEYPDDFIVQVFAAMALARQHTFQVLTKRPERMRDFLADPDITVEICKAIRELQGSPDLSWLAWPLPNVWGGTSAGNQQYAAERIPPLLDAQLAVRFVSLEPLLGRIDLTRLELVQDSPRRCGIRLNALTSTHVESCQPRTERGIDWVIVGGESGAKARPCDLAWIESLVAQCRAAGVPCFVKQLGSVPVEDKERWGARPLARILSVRNRKKEPPGTVALKYGDRKGGDVTEWPLELRVREWPRTTVPA